MLKLKFKLEFFDEPRVIAAVDAATRRVLSKFGAFVRTTARQSIKKRKRVSMPMGPPSSHVGTLKRGILFGYDRERKAVVVGPVPFSGTVDSRSLPALEYGGRSTMRNRDGTEQSITVAPRPFMGPALAKERPKLPEMWRDSVR